MNPSHPSTRGQVQPALAVAIGAIVVVGIAVAVAISRPVAPSGPASSDRPSVSPSASPSPAPSVAPSAKPSAAPSSPASGSGTVALRNATDHDVKALVRDETGRLVAAVSGNPGDGMSAQWHKALVDQGDANTILVTWAGLPQDDTVDVNVEIRDGAVHVTLVQAGPVPYSDAMGEDRVISLTFDRAVSAGDVDVSVLDRTID